MKKFFILASAAIVALASCAKTEVVYNEEPQEIAFKQITDVMTKAPTPYTEGTLGVIAHYNNNLYFNNTQFLYNTEKGAWAGGKYWPFEGTLDFTVYAPFATASYAENILTINEVTADKVLYHGSQRYVGVDKTDKVPVVLKHSSAMIGVALKGSTLYTVNKLTLKGANQKGNVKVTYESTAEKSYAVASVETVNPTTHDFVLYSSDTKLTDSETDYATCYVLPGTQTNIEITFTQAAENGIAFTKKIQLNGDWKANHKYTYLVNITADEIYLTATVADWDAEVTHEDKTNTDLVAL